MMLMQYAPDLVLSHDHGLAVDCIGLVVKPSRSSSVAMLRGNDGLLLRRLTLAYPATAMQPHDQRRNDVDQFTQLPLPAGNNDSSAGLNCTVAKC